MNSTTSAAGTPAYLVGDIGGTNSRLALCDPATGQLSHQARLRNDDFDSFEAALSHYLEHEAKGAGISSCCFAIAGPASVTAARLTNRDWHIRRDWICTQTGAGAVTLINDLTALGYAVPSIDAAGFEEIRPRAPGAVRNGQSLVIGLGTGCNVCQSIQCSENGYVVTEAEAGHSALPQTAARLLQEAVGETRSARFQTVEDCLSGPGLVRLYEALSGAEAEAATQIVKAGQGGDALASRAMDLAMSLVAYSLTTLLHLFRPLDGIYLAGSVSRGLLATDARAAFLSHLSASQEGLTQLQGIPIHLILEDDVALTGCARKLGVPVLSTV